jgi:Protein of unknown function (DUF2637)
VTNPPVSRRPPTPHRTDGRKGVVWGAGLVVALGAGVATAHGLYEVAIAAGVPPMIAWLYPLITDGLALVAYAATARLTVRGRGYAWTVVVLAAGLSGLGQASYLAGGVATAPVALRFGVGAWPAIAAAIVAHLVYLLGGHGERVQVARSTGAAAIRTTAVAVQPDGHPYKTGAYEPSALNDGVQSPAGVDERPAAAGSVRRVRGGVSGGGTPARDRARASARSHQARHGELPTVTELCEAAEVARGTAGAVLKELRQERHPLVIVHGNTETRSDQ